MKHLIIPYSHFLGEIIPLWKVFPNFLNCLYQSNDFMYFRLLTAFPPSNKKPTETLFLLAFLTSKT